MKVDQVLIVEDDPGMAELMRVSIARAGFGASVSVLPQAALSQALDRPPDLILLDVVMSGLHGFDLARRLQADDRTRHVPIIFVSALAEPTDVVRGLDLGAVDYVTKPFSIVELLSRVKAALRLKAAQDELRRANVELASLALIDSLTGLHNRRSIMDRLTQAVAYAARRHEALACLMLDLDNFKEINDRYGHKQGDAVLKELANVLRRTVRTSDTAGRYGGEEFAVICPSTDLKAALLLAERIRAAVEFHGFDGPGPGGRLAVTVSVGCAADQPPPGGGEDLLWRADSALYEAKRAGRNCVRGE